MRKKYIEHPNYQGYDRREGMANGNSVLKTTLWTILWCLLVGSYGFTLVIAMEAKNTFVANNINYTGKIDEVRKEAEAKITTHSETEKIEYKDLLTTVNTNNEKNNLAHTEILVKLGRISEKLGIK